MKLVFELELTILHLLTDSKHALIDLIEKKVAMNRLLSMRFKQFEAVSPCYTK